MLNTLSLLLTRRRIMMNQDNQTTEDDEPTISDEIAYVASTTDLSPEMTEEMSAYAYIVVLNINWSLYAYCANSPIYYSSSDSYMVLPSDTVRFLSSDNSTWASTSNPSLGTETNGYCKESYSRTLSQIEWSNHDVYYWES